MMMRPRGVLSADTSKKVLTGILSSVVLLRFLNWFMQGVSLASFRDEMTGPLRLSSMADNVRVIGVCRKTKG